MSSFCKIFTFSHLGSSSVKVIQQLKHQKQHCKPLLKIAEKPEKIFAMALFFYVRYCICRSPSPACQCDRGDPPLPPAESGGKARPLEMNVGLIVQILAWKYVFLPHPIKLITPLPSPPPRNMSFFLLTHTLPGMYLYSYYYYSNFLLAVTLLIQ